MSCHSRCSAYWEGGGEEREFRGRKTTWWNDGDWKIKGNERIWRKRKTKTLGEIEGSSDNSATDQGEWAAETFGWRAQGSRDSCMLKNF